MFNLIVTRRSGRSPLVALPLLCMLLAPAAAPSARAQFNQRVTAIGKAEGTGLKASDEAKQDAKRNAVEQACGVFINAQTEVENFQVIKDRILADVGGYLSDMRVIREWVEGGITHCEISAVVSVAAFERDWAAFAQLREDVGNPRCVIVITEDNDVDDQNPPQVNGICQSKLENFFLSKGVMLMDKGVVEDVRQRDVDLAAVSGDTQALAARAAAFSADVLVYGNAEAKAGGPVELAGRNLYRWDIKLNVRVIQADSAQLLASNSYAPTKPWHSTTAACGDDAFAKLADEVAEKVLRDVAEAWRKRAVNYRILPVIFQDCSWSDFTDRIAPALTQVRGVKQGAEGVRLREVVSNVATVDVYWSFDPMLLAKSIATLKVEGMRFDIIEQSHNRIVVKITRTP